VRRRMSSQTEPMDAPRCCYTNPVRIHNQRQYHLPGLLDRLLRLRSTRSSDGGARAATTTTGWRDYGPRSSQYFAMGVVLRPFPFLRAGDELERLSLATGNLS